MNVYQKKQKVYLFFRVYLNDVFIFLRHHQARSVGWPQHIYEEIVRENIQLFNLLPLNITTTRDAIPENKVELGLILSQNIIYYHLFHDSGSRGGGVLGSGHPPPHFWPMM